MTARRPEATAAAGDPLGAIAGALMQPLGADGVYGRTALYEDIIDRLGQLISRQCRETAEVLRFPPVMSRGQLERSGYLKSFPNLLGCVCVLHGSEATIGAAAARHESGDDWTTSLAAADLVLTPAACYPLYPLVAGRGRVPAEGLLFDVAADCFRREPSRALERLQSFRMRELVCVGSPEQVTSFRETWMERAGRLAAELALPSTLEAATDPFFGRVGQVMAVSQFQQALKFELLIPLQQAAKPTACVSFNYHREHFAEIWGLKDSRQQLAHTGCVAFGMDRLALALFAQHGLDLARWPGATRRALRL